MPSTLFNRFCRKPVFAAALCAAIVGSSPIQAEDVKAEKPAAEKAEEKPKTSDSKKADKDGWKELFNGKDLEGWKITNFGGEGEVYVENGEVVITQGANLTIVIQGLMLFFCYQCN